MTPEEGRAIYCSLAFLDEHPQMLDECFPAKWEWVCFSEDPIRNIKEHCAMYRRDLDPLGIFATPTPVPTPEPLLTPVPTATPDPMPEPTPEPESTATSTP